MQKNKFMEVVLKKIQSYSFIIFIVLIVGAFFALSQINRTQDTPKPDDDDVTANPDDDDDTDNPNDDTVVLEDEVIKLPVTNSGITIARGYWDLSAPTVEQVAAQFKVDNTWFENTGVNYTVDNETVFDVFASLTGTVSVVREDSLLGYVVEIEHIDGITTRYQSLSAVNVTVGDEIAQGDMIGESGVSWDTESGVHVHFEILKDNVNYNPSEWVGTQVKNIGNE